MRFHTGYAIPLLAMRFHYLLCDSITYYAIPLLTRRFHYWLCDSITDYAIPLLTMRFHYWLHYSITYYSSSLAVASLAHVVASSYFPKQPAKTRCRSCTAILPPKSDAFPGKASARPSAGSSSTNQPRYGCVRARRSCGAMWALGIHSRDLHL